MLLVAGASACATPRSPVAPARDHEGMISDLRAQNAGYARRIEELENRLFLLEDQVDRRVPAAEPQLRAEARAPVTVVEAPPPPVTAGPAVHQPYIFDGSSVIAEHEVEYAGEALLPTIRAGERPPAFSLAAASATELSPAASPRRLAPMRLYRRGLAAHRLGRHTVAIARLRRFLARSPRHHRADDARYLIGASYRELGQLAQAERELRRVLERHPSGNRVPDTMLALGLVQLERGDVVGARAMLAGLARAFPRHDAGREAGERALALAPPPLPLALPEPTPGTTRLRAVAVAAGGGIGTP